MNPSLCTYTLKIAGSGLKEIEEIMDYVGMKAPIRIAINRKGRAVFVLELLLLWRWSVRPSGRSGLGSGTRVGSPSIKSNGRST